MTTCAIFGITGDLSRKKLLPAFSHLLSPKYKESFKNPFQVIGIGRGHITQDELHTIFGTNKKVLSAVTSYISGAYEDEKLYEQLLGKAAESKSNEIAAYISLPPFTYETILKTFGKVLAKANKKLRVRFYFEKPFGLSLKDAKKLFTLARKYKLDIFVVDHYKHKGAVKAFPELDTAKKAQIAQLIADPATKISFSAPEESHAQNRGAFYDATGALRDFFQNHFLQVYSAFSKTKLANLEIKKLKISSPIRAQYKTYLQAKGVHPVSNTETFFSFALSPLWGKHKKAVTFSSGKGFSAKIAGSDVTISNGKDVLIINFSGNERIEMNGKVWWKKDPKQDAYICVLASMLFNNKAAFVSESEIYASWAITEKVKSILIKQPLLTYSLGSDTVPAC